MGYFADHASDGSLEKHRLYYLGIPKPQVTVAGAVSSGSRTVTPPSMEDIAIGSVLTVMDYDVAALGCTVSAALAGAGAGNVNNGAHSYIIVVNRTGGIHTGPSAPSLALTVVDKTTNGKVTVTRTGGALPTGYTWDIYRTAANADRTLLASYKLVNVGSPISASTTTYQDNVADASRGALVPTASTGGTNPELVTVTAKTLTTFTATFAKAHFANWLLGVSKPYYWTDCTDHDIEWNGHRWTSQPITPGAVTPQPETATAAFSIADADDVIFPVLATNNGAEMALAEIYETAFSPTNRTPVPDDVLQIFSGRVDYASCDSAGNADSITFNLMPPATLAAGQLPTRLISSLVRAS